MAGIWFAPHYAVPESWTCIAPCVLHTAPLDTSETVGELAVNDRFGVLEISGDLAWGFRERDNLVGYVDARALKRGDPE